MRPETSYARSGDLHIAYHVIGSGSRDLVLVSDSWNSIEAQWELPELASFLERLASFGRLISFDQSGSGLSDPIADSEPTLEHWMDDARVVMDAAGSEQATLLGFGGGGAPSMLFAATYPDRTSSLVVVNGTARWIQAPDYPAGRGAEAEDDVFETIEAGWGRGVFLDQIAPSRVGDESFREWWARCQRLGASPGMVLAMRRMFDKMDIRDVLPAIQAPTLVIAREENTWVRAGHSRYLAEHIPGAEYVSVPGRDYLPFLGDSEAVLAAIGGFLAKGGVEVHHTNRVLATILFTDIVGSTMIAAEVGDHAWTQTLTRHNAAINEEVERFGGRVVNTTGDGAVAIFDGPARAIRSARAIGDALTPLGLEIRAGLHTGEVELRASDVQGVAVHIAQRVMASAGSGEIYVSSTVRDLTAGSGIEFVDLGTRTLKNVPGTWHLFSVAA
jgi:class 3 adenylate cyclase